MALAGVFMLVAAVSAIPMNLQTFPDAVDNGAVCLDGSPYAFYYSPSVGNNATNDWQIYFEGGGWCYDEMDCWGRSKTSLGTSTQWGPTDDLTGMLNDDCTVNPDFCNFNRVLLKYCDGNSFSGNRTEPLWVNDDALWFRGHQIVNFAFKKLFSQFGLSQARNVLLTGCSAGGLSTYLHADYVGELLAAGAPNLQMYRAASISGFFLMHPNVQRVPVYPIQMRYINELSNASPGVNAACVAAQPPELQWLCNFAQYSYQYTKTSIFVLNSALDSWQIPCIYTSELAPAFPNQTGTENGMCDAVPAYQQCGGNPAACTPSQLSVLLQYEYDFHSIISSIPTFNKPGNGGFIHSYFTHCEAQADPYFMDFQVNGTTMRDAVHKWWTRPLSTPASENTYLCLPWPKTCATTTGKGRVPFPVKSEE